ncbi:hypothetical protein [Tunturiibacter lichenicola]|uniref:hypothetical protein n=1 Tax=Tunturiibacter lichenicola TaxID=2051959 RepID=UPI003D9B684A
MDTAESRQHLSDSPPQTTVARSVLIVDDLPELLPLLAKKNFIMFGLTPGATEEQIGELVAHRVLVTKRPDLWR